MLLAVFMLELEMDYPSETGLRTVAPSPQTLLLRFFSDGRGQAYLPTGVSGADNPVFKLSVKIDG